MRYLNALHTHLITHVTLRSQVGSGAAPVQRNWVSSFIPFSGGPPKNIPRPTRPEKSSFSDSLSKVAHDTFLQLVLFWLNVIVNLHSVAVNI